MASVPATRQQAASEVRAASLVLNNADRLKAALPAHYTPGKLAQVMTVLVFRNPEILRCAEESVITSLITAATLDLDLTPGMNEGALVPRWNTKANCLECQFQPMYQGLAKLAIRTGSVRWIQPREVCVGDDFEVWHEDEKTHFRHKPAFGQKRDQVLYYYAVAKMADGDPLIEVMTAEDVEAIHQRSDGYKTAVKKGWQESGPWVSDYNAMGRKTVIRKLCKCLPRKSSDPAAVKAFEDLNRALEADNRQYETDPADVPPPAHHAINHDNATGHGSGAYARPESVAAYRAWLSDFVGDVNAKWLDKHTSESGEIPDGVKAELVSTWQVGGHLLKWAVSEGLVNAPDDARPAQRDKFTAVAWERNRPALIAEAEDYARRKWREERAVLAAREQPQQDTDDESDPEGWEPGQDG